MDDFAGKPLLLEPWQREIMDEALELDDDGRPKWSSVALVLPRKNGKTAMLAAFAVYRLLDAGSPEILLAAASDKQANRLFDACARFVRSNAKLRAACSISEYQGRIAGPDGGKILRMSTDALTLYGYSPSLVVADEVGFWTTPNLRRAWDALTTGGGARSRPQTFTISTAGEAHTRHDGLLGRLLDAALADPELERTPGRLIGRLHGARTLVVAYEAPTADRHDIDAIKLANPASWVTEAWLRRQAENPELSDQAFLQLHGCVWAERSASWLPAGAWDALEKPYRLPPDDTRIVLAFDGSDRRDSTALVGCTLVADDERPHVFVVGVWERPLGVRDWHVPRADVDRAVREAVERWDVEELACDPPGWQHEIDLWSDELDDVPVVRYETRSGQFERDLDRFHSAVIAGDFTHDGDSRLATHVANAVPRPGRRGWREDHERSPGFAAEDRLGGCRDDRLRTG